MVQSDEKRAMGKFAPPSGQSQGDAGLVIREKQVGRRPPVTRLRRQLSSKCMNSADSAIICIPDDPSDEFPSLLVRVADRIGRFFVICFNLVISGHFLLPATVALLLYLVFGLVQPVIYGYTLDDKDYKLEGAVLVGYILCVIILTAKAYMGGANEFTFKTILYNVITASTASGVGLAAGHLIKRLMGQSHLPLFRSETISQNPLWAAY